MLHTCALVLPVLSNTLFLWSHFCVSARIKNWKKKKWNFSEILNSWNGFNQGACYLSQCTLACSSATQTCAEFNAKQSRQKYAYKRKWTVLGKNMRTPCNKYFDSSDFLNLLTSSLKLLDGNTWWMALANLVFAQQVNTQKHFKSVKRFSLTLSQGAKSYLFIFLWVKKQRHRTSNYTSESIMKSF